MVSKTTTSSQENASSPDTWSLWDVILVALFLSRFFVPTESMEQGHTLWIAAFWLALGTCRFWWAWRNHSGFFLKFEPVDLGVAALAGGFCLAGIIVLIGGGDRRAALNGLWEWVSLGVMWLIMKERLQRYSVRRLISWSLLITVITLSGLGIWQHFVWYPQQAQGLSKLFELQDRLDAGDALDQSERTQYDHLRSEFGTDTLMLGTSGRRMLLDRTRYSVEPIGRFALANSFAALLIMGWWGALDLFRSSYRSRHSVISLLVVGFVAALIFICLLLTKSRTALVGIFGGTLWLTIFLINLQGMRVTSILRWGGLLLGAGLVLAVGVSLVGGLDWEVLIEAPKSLTYRWEYWRATWKLIEANPLFGVGPGNFRPHYFAHKLPGSSEEILDPHNLFLDAWANGGLLAFVGLVILCCLWIARLIHAQAEISRDEELKTSINSPGLLVGLLALILVIGEEWLLEGFLDIQLCWLAVAWCGIHFFLGRIIPAQSLSLPMALGAGTTLFVHLLGAGGLSMPAILQILLLLLLLASPPTRAVRSCSQRQLLMAMVVCLVLTVGCLWSGLVPVVMTARLLEQGREQAIVSHRLVQAEKTFREATQVDRLAAEPHAQLAGILFERWRRSGGDDESLFLAAVHEEEEAIQRNPRSPKEYLTLSNWWAERHRRHPNPEFAKAAVEAAQQGVQLYPTFALLQSRLAFALQSAGELKAAASVARVALHLDDLNHEHGHIDKLLQPHDRDMLEKLSEGQNE